MELVSHCPWVLQATARLSIIWSMEMVPSLIISFETGLSVILSIRLRYGIVQLTGKFQIAIFIDNAGRM